MLFQGWLLNHTSGIQASYRLSLDLSVSDSMLAPQIILLAVSSGRCKQLGIRITLWYNWQDFLIQQKHSFVRESKFMSTFHGKISLRYFLSILGQKRTEG